MLTEEQLKYFESLGIGETTILLNIPNGSVLVPIDKLNKLIQENITLREQRDRTLREWGKTLDDSEYILNAKSDGQV